MVDNRLNPFDRQPCVSDSPFIVVVIKVEGVEPFIVQPDFLHNLLTKHNARPVRNDVRKAQTIGVCILSDYL